MKSINGFKIVLWYTFYILLNIVKSLLGLAFALMLRPFFPELVMSTDLLFCFSQLHVMEDDTYNSGYRTYHRTSMPFMVRDDIPGVNETRERTAGSEFMVIMGRSFSYTLHWTKAVPNVFHITAKGISK